LRRAVVTAFRLWGMPITAARHVFVALAAILVNVSLAPAHDHDDALRSTTVSQAVRCTDARLCTLLEDGRGHSPTLDALLARVIELKGLIYVAWTPALPPAMEAALLHHIQVTPDGVRCLWIVLHRRNHPSVGLIPVLAHELQHAIEVLEGAATSGPEIEGYFKRLTTSHGRVHETDAAQRVGGQVAGELRAR
jgi:hypothetical protein